MDAHTLSWSTLKVGALINTSSGGCDLSSQETMRSILNGAGIQDPKMWCSEAAHVEESFDEAFKEKFDVLIVLGGDGTIRSAAERCTKEGPYLIPLPGGTMNVLPKALYGESPWEEALSDTLSRPIAKTLSGGEVNKRQFFIAAIVGAPALLADAREAIRQGELGEAITKGNEALKTIAATHVTYQIEGGVEGVAETVAVICPFISEAMAETEQALEVAVIDIASVGEVIALVTAAAFGKWREDKNILLTKSRKVSFSAAQNIPAIFDGERIDLGQSAEIVFIPQAFGVLMPASPAV